jgi:hypothetical protein
MMMLGIAESYEKLARRARFLLDEEPRSSFLANSPIGAVNVDIIDHALDVFFDGRRAH